MDKEKNKRVKEWIVILLVAFIAGILGIILYKFII